MTGITRISKESIFLDLNNLVMVTTTSRMYQSCFGFTGEEVLAALEEYGLEEQAEAVRYWYDGFIFGDMAGIYNTWSMINYLKTGELAAYWANTSSNGLAGKLIREENRNIKQSFERLLYGESIKCQLDEQVIYSQLSRSDNAIWSLLLASGYLKVRNHRIMSTEFEEWVPEYELELTNFEVRLMFKNMVKGWFDESAADYGDFIRALLTDDVEMMNVYMNRVALATFSCFDVGGEKEKAEPERFYHGFVPGLIVNLGGRYSITSNRESGLGRYDVMLEPTKAEDDAIILEFKVFDMKKEKSLEDTVRRAHEQIERKNYAAALLEKGISADRIRTYGFAFEGKMYGLDRKNRCGREYP